MAVESSQFIYIPPSLEEDGVPKEVMGHAISEATKENTTQIIIKKLEPTFYKFSVTTTYDLDGESKDRSTSFS